MMRCSFIILSIIFFNSAFLAQRFWEPLEGPFGGEVTAIGLLPNNSAFVSIKAKGIYRSTDGGLNWMFSTPNEASAIKVDRRGRIFARFDNQLFFSTDTGSTWLSFNNQVPDYAHFDIDSIGYIYALSSSNNKLYKLDENGIIISIQGNLPLNSYDISAFGIKRDNNTLYLLNRYLANNNLVYHSVDGGNSWTAQDNGLSNIYSLSTLAFSPGWDIIYIGSGEWSVFQSDNNGDTWLPVVDAFIYMTATNAIGINSQYDIFISCSQIFDPASYKNIFKRVNFGGGGMEIHNIPSASIYKIEIDSDDNVWIAVKNQLYYSSDNGLNWDPRLYGISALTASEIKIHPNGNIFAVSEGILYRSTDNGTSWEILAINNHREDVHNLAFDLQGNVWVTFSERGLLRSTDGGDTWNGIIAPWANVNTIAANDSNDIFLGSIFSTQYNFGIFRSMDNGNSWQEVLAYDSTNVVNVYDLVTQNSLAVFAVTNNGIYRSRDNGDNWEKIRNFINSRSLNLSTTPFNTLFYNRANQLYRSIDQGDSWELVADDSLGIIHDILVTGEMEIWLAADSGAFRSMDNGNNWKAYNAGLPGTPVHSLSISPENRLFAGSANRGIYRSETLTGITAYEYSQISDLFVLSPNFPNPFNPLTFIRYKLLKTARVQLKIYNLLGEEVNILIDEQQMPGEYQIPWDSKTKTGKEVSSGIYFYRLIIGQYNGVGKMVLLR